MKKENIINQNELEALKMEWKDVEPKGILPKDKMLLDTLASTFMLTSFGRPSMLFRASINMLHKEEYLKLERNKTNHLYLANIAICLLDKNTPLLQLGQLFKLIQDLEVTLLSGESPYKNKYVGIQKWNHPDFKGIRSSIKKYFHRLSKDPKAKLRAYYGISEAKETTIDSLINITERVAGLTDITTE